MNTSSEGLLLTADTSTVRAEDLGSVFQRFNNYNHQRRRPFPHDLEQQQQQQYPSPSSQHQQHHRYEFDAPRDASKVRHHHYRHYHHEESMAPRALLSRDGGDEQYRQHQQHQSLVGHRYSNIESPRSRGSHQYRREEESATRRRLKMLLDHDVDDDLYYDDDRRDSAQKTAEANASFRRTIFVVAVICIVATVGIVCLLASCGDGNPVRGLQQMFASGESQVPAVSSTDNDGGDYKRVDNTDMMATLLPDTAVGIDIGNDGYMDNVTNDYYHDQLYQHQQQVYQQQQKQQEEQHQQQEDYQENEQSAGTPILLPPVDPSQYYTQQQYEQQQYYEQQQQHQQQEQQQERPAIRHPSQPPGDVPASLVPGAENRSRVDMMREVPQPNMSKDVTRIYGKRSGSLLGDGRDLYEASGGADAERYMGMTEPPEYDPSKDPTLNSEENAKKSMISLYNQHKQKMDPNYGVHLPPQPQHQQPQQHATAAQQRRPQRRSDTQPMMQIRSVDENYGAAQVKRKHIAAQSQVAVSQIYNKKQQQRSAAAANFVHEPATANGMEYMNVHTQTYLGEEDR